MDVRVSAHSPVRSKRRIFRLIKKEQPALQALGVQRLGLFGSFVGNEQRADSYVDLLVEFLPGLTCCRRSSMPLSPVE